MQKLRITLNSDKCLGCRACEMACAVAHSLSKELLAAVMEDPAPAARVRVVVGKKGENAALRCVHCNKPKCVEACEVGALSRDEQTGLVLLDEEKCVGCLECVEACPFDAIFVVREGQDNQAVIKCDLCADRQQAGEGPACVEACPTGALSVKVGQKAKA
jgi:carbon-monoxide dehydrogenase iron sulfur subunit